MSPEHTRARHAPRVLESSVAVSVFASSCTILVEAPRVPRGCLTRPPSPPFLLFWSGGLCTQAAREMVSSGVVPEDGTQVVSTACGGKREEGRDEEGGKGGRAGRRLVPALALGSDPEDLFQFPSRTRKRYNATALPLSVEEAEKNRDCFLGKSRDAEGYAKRET